MGLFKGPALEWQEEDEPTKKLERCTRKSTSAEILAERTRLTALLINLNKEIHLFAGSDQHYQLEKSHEDFARKLSDRLDELNTWLGERVREENVAVPDRSQDNRREHDRDRGAL